jgi:hypothetical protein
VTRPARNETSTRPSPAVAAAPRRTSTREHR